MVIVRKEGQCCGRLGLTVALIELTIKNLKATRQQIDRNRRCAVIHPVQIREAVAIDVGNAGQRKLEHHRYHRQVIDIVVAQGVHHRHRVKVPVNNQRAAVVDRHQRANQPQRMESRGNQQRAIPRPRRPTGGQRRLHAVADHIVVSQQGALGQSRRATGIHLKQHVVSADRHIDRLTHTLKPA